MDFAAAAIVKRHGRKLKGVRDLAGDLLGYRLRRVREQDRAAEGIESFHFSLSVDRLPGPTLGPGRKLTGDERSDKKGEDGHPVLRIGDGERANRRKEKVIETQHRDDRRNDRLQESPGGGN